MRGSVTGSGEGNRPRHGLSGQRRADTEAASWPEAAASHGLQPGLAAPQSYVFLFLAAGDKAVSKFSPEGEPRPEHASHPGPAEKAPFDPVTMS